jgi:cyclopropane fatty-acyl-phospholipid synthase-like methyltransferase
MLKTVTEYFDERSAVYIRSEFTDYQFSAREKAATANDDLGKASILDMGCGTGRLYDHFNTAFPSSDFTYLGVDPSVGMLHASTIPVDNRKVGVAGDLVTEARSFDRIYLLGVTTYIPRKALKDDLDVLWGKLNQGGKIMIHFTRKNSLEVILRQLLRPLLQRIFPGKGIASASFKTCTYGLEEARELLSGTTEVREEALVASVPFLQHISPQMAIRISKRMSRWAPNFLRPDFLFVFSK